MTLSRLEDYLEHMHQASADACSFVDGMSKSDFLQDKRTQQAVIMSFVILGEASRKIMDSYPEFVANQPTILGSNASGGWLTRRFTLAATMSVITAPCRKRLVP